MIKVSPALAALLCATALWAQDVKVVADGTTIPYCMGKAAHLVPPSEKFIEEKSLEFDGNINAPKDPGGDPANGAKFYAFVLAPQEKLTVKLKGENSNHLGMTAVQPAVVDRMQSQYVRLERVPRPLRSSRFEIQNITDQPYTIYLMVYGTVNHWYNLTIERKI